MAFVHRSVMDPEFVKSLANGTEWMTGRKVEYTAMRDIDGQNTCTVLADEKKEERSKGERQSWWRLRHVRQRKRRTGRGVWQSCEGRFIILAFSKARPPRRPGIICLPGLGAAECE